eukprot:1158892-Pelagomonas_calceolata.AAC.6
MAAAGCDICWSSMTAFVEVRKAQPCQISNNHPQSSALSSDSSDPSKIKQAFLGKAQGLISGVESPPQVPTWQSQCKTCHIPQHDVASLALAASPAAVMPRHAAASHTLHFMQAQQLLCHSMMSLLVPCTSYECSRS